MDQHMSRRHFLKVTAGATALATSVDASASLLVPTVQVASAATQYVPQPTNRVRMLIDAGWQFILEDVAGAQATKFDDSSWKQVDLPHSFDTPYFQALTWYQGYGWYRRHFPITANQKKARRISLEFEAAFQDAQVYVNGTLVGEHIGGFTGFIFDITSAVHEGDNVVAVRLNNKWNAQLAPRAGDYHFSGGITRDVYLVITDPLHVTWYGTYVTTPQVSTARATVNVQTEVQNQSPTTKQVTLTTTIVDATHAVVQTMTASSSIAAGATHTFAQTGTVANPHLWSPESPYLYTVYSAVQDGGTLVDSYSSPLGIRSIRWSATEGFFLNGKHYLLDGANVHQDIAGWSDAATNADYYRKAKFIKEAGFNAVRESHYPHDVAFNTACDQLGILVWSELCYWGCLFSTTEQPDWSQSAYPTRSQDWEPFETNLKHMLTEMIRERRNHPSTIIWSMCNEVFFTAGSVADRTTALVRTLATLAKSLDPSRLAGAGGAQRMGIDKCADVAGYNGDGATIAEYQNPGFPSVVTEYYATGSTYPFPGIPETHPWRAGMIFWEGFDHGTHIGGAGFDGLVDFYGRPRQLWYEFRKHNLGTSYTLPSEGTAAKLAISSDKATILGDGTNSAVITVQVQDDSGHDVSNNPDVTLTITSGPGAFPTGKTMTFNASNPYHMLNGMARITFRSCLSGRTIITASSPGLPSANLTVTTTQAALSANTYYALVNCKSGKVLDTANGATTAGTSIIQRRDQVSASQQWRFVSVGSGYYKLVNRQSGTVLDISKGSKSPGAQLQLGSDANSTNLQWQLVDAGRGYFYLTNRNSRLNAEVSNASTADGAAIILQTPNSDTSQQWQLLPCTQHSPVKGGAKPRKKRKGVR
jgi:beta-galactosidase